MLAIDIHILTLPGDNPAWLQEAVDSVAAIPGATPHIVQGIPGHLGQSRVRGYAQGNARFVSFVDSDDFLLPGFAGLGPTLDSAPDAAACYGQLLADQGGIYTPQPALKHWTRQRMARRPRSVRAPIVYRREAIMPYLSELDNWPRYADRILAALAATHGRFLYHPIACYGWRQHDNNMHHAEDLNERMRARHFIARLAAQC